MNPIISLSDAIEWFVFHSLFHLINFRFYNELRTEYVTIDAIFIRMEKFPEPLMDFPTENPVTFKLVRYSS